MKSQSFATIGHSDLVFLLLNCDVGRIELGRWRLCPAVAGRPSLSIPLQVMRTFGWSPTESELQVTRINYAKFGSCRKLKKSSNNHFLGDDKWDRPGRERRDQFQWVCMADDQVGDSYTTEGYKRSNEEGLHTLL